MNIANYYVIIFGDKYSSASYLIAEQYINKIINEDCTGSKIEVRDLSEDQLEILKEMGNIYDDDNSQLVINDIDNLTLKEQQAILISRTGNPSYNSFAAENLYHAYMLNKHGNSAMLSFYDKYIIKRAIISDTGVGEEKYVFGKTIAKSYKDYDGKYVKQQREIFGDK